MFRANFRGWLGGCLGGWAGAYSQILKNRKLLYYNTLSNEISVTI